ncbi:hypothetical protein LZK73_06200 [Neorhizobium galegae]|nr:hypothetical protein LZK73_06200 [Neorhizobium galegae]
MAWLGLAVTVVVERVVVEAQRIDDAQAAAGQFAEDQHLQRHRPARGIPALPAWREPRQRTLDPVAQLAIDRHGHFQKRKISNSFNPIQPTISSAGDGVKT